MSSYCCVFVDKIHKYRECREIHCDAPAETEWEKWAQNLQLKVGLQPPKVGNWTGFAKKKFSFFSFRKSTGKKILSPGKSVCQHRSQPI